MDKEPNITRRFEPEMIVAISAVVVGLCALGVSVYQASLMRQQQEELTAQRKAEVWPHLEFGVSNPGDAFKFILVNTGIGPARIQTIKMTLDEKPVLDWASLLRDINHTGSYNYFHSQINGRVLRAGDQIDALTLEGSIADSVQANLHQIQASFCYCSVYDDCWILDQDFGSEVMRSQVDGCGVGDLDFEQ